jgi:hypothetical protein
MIIADRVLREAHKEIGLAGSRREEYGELEL